MGSCSAFDARKTNAAMPTSITRNAATTETTWKRRSSASGTNDPRRITSRTTSGPISNASAAKSPHRARSSRHVVPDAPTASVGGGAATPTPKVNTPPGLCPSSPITLQRTVYPLPRASRETGATTTYPSSSVRAVPETTVPSGASTSMAFAEMVTGSLKRSRTAVGGVSTRDCVTGSELRRLTWASAADGATSAHSITKRRTRLRVTVRSTRSDRRWERRPDRRRGGRRAART